jgi:hypothetical protein
LRELAQEIQHYLHSLNYLGESGVGYRELTELRDMTKKKLAGKGVADEDIVATAENALRFHSHSRSAHIQDLIGKIQVLIK